MKKTFPKSKNEILALVGPVSNLEQFEYLNFHVIRYQYLLQKILGFFTVQTNKVLDIGTGFEVDLIRSVFGVGVDTMGFYHSGWQSFKNETFYEINLNNQEALKQPKDKYSLIIMAEVIEHLYTAPETVLENLRNWLTEDGILIIQTPNALSLPKRLKMLFGIHPFEKIRVNKQNPGHFREYTVQELIQICETAGFEVLEASSKNYFQPKNTLLQFLYSLEFLWPKCLRTGLTVVAKRI